jgi:hypothetical protein
VSDSHGGVDQRWASGTNNLLSWIYARGPGKAELIAGMRAGRVYFGDLTLFRGLLDLKTADGFRMGQIVVTDRPSFRVDLDVVGATRGDVLRVVRNGESGESWTIAGDSARESYEAKIDAGAATVVRVELADAQGRQKAFSNPITFVRSVPPAGIASDRAGVALGALVSRRVERIDLRRVEAGEEAGRASVTICGSGRDGAIELDVARAGTPPHVEFDGWRGRSTFEGGRLALGGLSGEGCVAIALAAPAATLRTLRNSGTRS